MQPGDVAGSVRASPGDRFDESLTAGEAAAPAPASCVLNVSGAEAIIVDLNHSFADQFGLALDLSRGRALRHLLLAETALRMEECAKRALIKGGVVRALAPYQVGAHVRHVRVEFKPLSGGRVMATIVETDAAKRIDMPSQLLNTLGAVNDGMIYVLDIANGKVVLVTDKVREIFGYTREQVEGQVVDPAAEGLTLFANFFHPEEGAVVARHFDDLARAPDDEVMTMLCRARHANGSWRWIEVRSRVLTRDRTGAARRIIGVATDMTARKRLNDDLRAASHALLIAEESERRRIAREIHDSTAQHLVAMDLGLSRINEQLRAQSGPMSEVLAEQLAELRALVKTAQSDVRVASFALHPPELSKHGLAHAIEELARGFGRRSRIKVDFHLEGEARPLTPATEHALLRVAQEALQNVYKHAQARHVRLLLAFDDRSCLLEVEDDGVGAVGGANSAAGVGLESMRARVRAIGGVLSIVARRSGYLVRAWIGDSA